MLAASVLAAAVRLRKRKRKETELAQELEHVLRVLGAAVDRMRPRCDFLARDAMHERLNLPVLLV